MQLSKLGLAWKLLIALLILDGLSLVALGVSDARQTRQQAHADALQAIEIMAAKEASAIEGWASRVEDQLTYFAGSERVLSAVSALSDARLDGTASGDLPANAGAESERFERVLDRVAPDLEVIQRIGGFDALYVTDAQNRLLYRAGSTATDQAPDAGRFDRDSTLPRNIGITAQSGPDNIMVGDVIISVLLSDATVGSITVVQGVDRVLANAGVNGPAKLRSVGVDGDLTSGAVGGPSVLQGVAPVSILGQEWSLSIERHAPDLAPLAAANGPSGLIVGTALIGVVGLLAFAVMVFSLKPLKGMTRSLGLMRQGDYSEEIKMPRSRDELGVMARGLEELRQTLAMNSANQEENKFKSAAVEATSAALMLTDANFNITYMNNAVIELMDNRVSDFRQLIPDFDPRELIGVNMDRFHKVPERIQTILRNPANLPFRTDIYIGQASVQLEINSVLDSNDAICGLVVEWVDVTDLRRNEAVLAAINTSQAKAEFSIKGDLSQSNENFKQAVDASGPAANLSTIFTPLDDALVSGAIADKIRDEEIVRGHFTMSGTGKILDGGFYPIRARSGKPAGIVFLGSDVTAEQQALNAAEAERRMMQASQEQVVDGLRVGLKAIADGNLTYRLTSQFARDYEQLRVDFNAAVEKLTEAMSVVAEESSCMRQETAEIVKAADDMARRTETQAMTLQSTATSLGELTANVAGTAKGAAKANHLVAQARQSAESSGPVVDHAEAAMAEIAASSKEVTKVISVIDDIAFQTNLLALNAGVEAARAGEAGRGFAVVATEVRALAQRCSDAAAEINNLISTSDQHVTQGVDLVGQTGSALKTIVGSISEISGYIEEIAKSGDEQSKGLGTINDAVGEIDHATQQNAAMFEETTSAAHALAHRAQSLALSMSKFDIGVDMNKGASAYADILAPMTKPAVAVAANGASGAIQSTSNDDWREF